ncbi:MAG: signal peptidase II [Spirochaetales bacterium]|nr:signal peptidase II [Spirochaetales bacterium]
MLDKKRLQPFILTIVVVLLDQITKLIIIKTIPAYDWDSFINVIGDDFFRIIHVKNLGVAFSMGSGLPDIFRFVLMKILPLLVLAWVGWMVYHREKEGLTVFQSWLLAGVIGGGLGNLIDRFFRPDGVVDFLDVKFYGLFGLERWPTFNVADAAVVVTVILLLISLLCQAVKKKDSHE